MGHLPASRSSLGAILRLLRTLLFWQLALLAVVAFVWWLTDWRTNSTYGSALINAGEILVGLGTLSLMGMSGDTNMHQMEDEVEMQSWYQRSSRRFASLAEPWRPGIWIMTTGFVTAAIGLVLDMNGVFR